MPIFTSEVFGTIVPTSAVNYLNNQFAFESFTPETVFYVLPVYEDLLRAGQLDISNRVRRSNYSYLLQGTNLRIYPRPTQNNIKPMRTSMAALMLMLFVAADGKTGIVKRCPA